MATNSIGNALTNAVIKENAVLTQHYGKSGNDNQKDIEVQDVDTHQTAKRLLTRNRLQNAISHRPWIRVLKKRNDVRNLPRAIHYHGVQIQIRVLTSTKERVRGVIALYTNADGDSCLENWSTDDLMTAFKIAEQTGDDILYLAVMQEVEKRKLVIVDKNPNV